MIDGVTKMYYLVTWTDGHTSRFFTYDQKRVRKLIWNFKVASVRIDLNQED